MTDTEPDFVPEIERLIEEDDGDEAAGLPPTAEAFAESAPTLEAYEAMMRRMT